METHLTVLIGFHFSMLIKKTFRFQNLGPIRTCKLFVPVSSTTKFGDEFPGQLEDEDGARLVVDDDHMTVLVYRNSFWPHESAGAEFSLMRSRGSRCDTPPMGFPNHQATANHKP